MNTAQISMKKILIIFGEICFLIICIAIFSNFNTSKPKIIIDNISSFNLSSNARDAIEESLYAQVIPYLNNQEAISKFGAKIKEGSFSRHEDNTARVYYGDFIVEYNGTDFTISYIWSDDEEVLNYLGNAITIKASFENKVYNIKTNIDYYLPATISIEGLLLDKVRQYYPEPDIDPAFVSISLKKSNTYSSKNKALDYFVVACGDEEIISESRTIVSDWISSSGFNPDDYKLNFRDACEGY